jgi:hypothetical protein
MPIATTIVATTTVMPRPTKREMIDEFGFGVKMLSSTKIPATAVNYKYNKLNSNITRGFGGRTMLVLFTGPPIGT